MNWIRTENKQPEVNKIVFLMVDDSIPAMGLYVGNDNYRVSSSLETEDSHSVTHWAEIEYPTE